MCCGCRTNACFSRRDWLLSASHCLHPIRQMECFSVRVFVEVCPSGAFSQNHLAVRQGRLRGFLTELLLDFRMEFVPAAVKVDRALRAHEDDHFPISGVHEGPFKVCLQLLLWI